MDTKAISALVTTAYSRIQTHLVRTPLIHDKSHHLWLKCEQLQTTGSFKWRGALSKLSSLQTGQTVVTASTGNHGMGVVKAADIFGMNVIVFLPVNASPGKKDKLIRSGVEVIQLEGDSLAAEMAGKKYAADHGFAWVSPYNDPQVIAGQGTIGFELLEQLPKIDRVYVTVGGGGLISGIAGYIKAQSPDTEIIGCQPLHSPEMYLSVLAGHVVNAPEELPTLSDGSAGPLEPDSITFPICQKLVDRFILVTEEEIRKAIQNVFHEQSATIEGAAGVAYAAALKDTDRSAKDISAVILCGGNIDPALHRQICQP